jgi:hypothetical protein
MAVDLQSSQIARTQPTWFSPVGSLEFIEEVLVMARLANQGDKWRILFHERRAELSAVAETLLFREISPEQILDSALTALEGSSFHEVFGPISAIRAVVKAAIASSCEVRNFQFHDVPANSMTDGLLRGLPTGKLPWLEHAAYFLREVLHYSRRDTALLLGISDVNVDELNRFARRRMGVPIDSQTPHVNSTRAVRSGHSMAFAAYE